MTQPSATTRRRLGPIRDAANVLGCSTDTVRRMVARGDLAAYRLPGSRLLRVDLDEVENAVQRVPTVDG